MLRGDGNARNKQDAAWRQFITLLEYKADLYGCHVVQVEPEGTFVRDSTLGSTPTDWPRPAAGTSPDCIATGVPQTDLSARRLARSRCL